MSGFKFDPSKPRLRKILREWEELTLRSMWDLREDGAKSKTVWESHSPHSCNTICIHQPVEIDGKCGILKNRMMRNVLSKRNKLHPRSWHRALGFE